VDDIYERNLRVSMPYLVPVLWRDPKRGDEAFSVEEAVAPMHVRAIPPGAMRTQVTRVSGGRRDYEITLAFEGRTWLPFTEHPVRDFLDKPLTLRPFRFMELILPDNMSREPTGHPGSRAAFMRTNTVQRLDHEALEWASSLVRGHVVHDGTNLFHAGELTRSPGRVLRPGQEALRSAVSEILHLSPKLVREAGESSRLAGNARQLRRTMLHGMVFSVPEEEMPFAWRTARETAAIVAATHPARTSREAMARLIEGMPDVPIPGDDEADLSTLAP
jgi:hypothetical protein